MQMNLLEKHSPLGYGPEFVVAEDFIETKLINGQLMNICSASIQFHIYRFGYFFQLYITFSHKIIYKYNPIQMNFNLYIKQ